jgi:serine/threonine protein kinase
LSPRSDLFSLGLVGFAMLAGRPPWSGGSLEDLLKARKREPLTALGELRPDAPAYLRQAIEKCLESNPRHRIKSATEFVACLDPDSSPPAARDSVSLRLRMGTGLRAVPAVLDRRIDGATGGKVAVVTATILTGILTFGVLRGNGDSVAHSAEELPIQTTTILEIPLPEQPGSESTADAGIADPSLRSPAASERGASSSTSPGATDAPARVRQPAASPLRARSLPRPLPGQNFASSQRLVLLGEPVSP